MSLRGGIDVGGTKIQAVIVDAADVVLASARQPTPSTGGPPDVAAAIADILGEAARIAGIAPAELAGIGVGSPGRVDAAQGTVAHAGNLPDWAGTYALAGDLHQRLGAPITLGNDVTVGIQAEFALGAGAGPTARCSACSGGPASAAA